MLAWAAMDAQILVRKVLEVFEVWHLVGHWLVGELVSVLGCLKAFQWMLLVKMVQIWVAESWHERTCP